MGRSRSSFIRGLWFWCLYRYGASSPDEGALVYSAHHFGISFLGRHSEGLSVSVLGRKALVRVLCSIDFSSSRKRSSVLVHVGFPSEKRTTDAGGCSSSSTSAATGLKGKILLLTKGADTVILPLLSKMGPLEERMVEVMQQYARDGLRTLCIAQREIDPETFLNWAKLYEEAENTTVNRQERIEQSVASICTLRSNQRRPSVS